MHERFVDFLTPYVGTLAAKVLAPSYFHFLLFALTFVPLVFFWRLQKGKVDLEPYLLASALGYFGIFVGGKASWMMFNAWQYSAEPAKLLRVYEGGLATFGAFGGGALLVFAVLRLRSVPFLPFVDFMAPAAALVLAISRLGCFVNGCCFGIPTSLPWGMSYAAGSGPWKAQYLNGALDGESYLSLPVHPVQLYESAAAFLICVYLWTRWDRRQFNGELAWLFVTAYGLLRFGLEFLRADERTYLVGNFSTVHLAAALMFCIGLWQYLNSRKQRVLISLQSEVGNDAVVQNAA